MHNALQSALSRVGKVETHPGILRIYRYDFLVIPKQLSRFVKTPICIVQPKSDEEVLKILEISERFEVPIITRGAGTSGYGGCVPLEESIILDMKNLNKCSFQNSSVVVEAGAIWAEIEKSANRLGKALRVYPTSATVSTVGGWIAQNGYGVGSLKYGSIGENVEWIEIADYDGIKQIKGEKLKYYIGAFGTTGIIIRACIKLRNAGNIRSSAFECTFEEALKQIGSAYHANFKDGYHMKFEKLGEKDTLLVSYEEEGESSELGKKLWDRRLSPLKALKKDKIYSEVVVPTEKALEFYNQVKELAYGIEAIFARDCVVFLGLFGRGLKQYLKALKFVKIAENLGGGIYATGLLFPHKNKAKKELEEYKRTVDPKNLLNPKKAFHNNSFSRIMKFGERLLWFT
ncbi:MAG: FAD-binding oxidoreductase [Archaeoglobaceae archaeon]|nr:FAD-binding oxidoreductase [Archaeoglobaceae archaeon]MDW8117861.1 FAD-binding oxidoreductase [Archaeoglobaceae archaeon]